MGYVETWGIPGYNAWNTGISMLICGTIFFIINYFFFGWHKMKAVDLAERPKAKLDRNSLLTLLGFAAFIIGNLVFKIDMMITPIIVAILLMSVGVADPKQCIKAIPWNTLIMFGGMTVYVGIIKNLGGVDLLSNWLLMICTNRTAVAVFCIIAGIMSVFSSANSVVLPTLVAIIPTVTQMLPGVSGAALLSAISVGANSTAISPMSTTGGNLLGYYSATYNPTDAEQQKVFNMFLMEAGLIFVINAVMAFFGIFDINFV